MRTRVCDDSPTAASTSSMDMAKETAEWENQWLGAGGAEGVMVAEVLSPKLKGYEGRMVSAGLASRCYKARAITHGDVRAVNPRRCADPPVTRL